MFTYLVNSSTQKPIPRAPDQKVVGKNKGKLDSGIEVNVTYIQKEVQVEKHVNGVKKSLCTDRTFMRCDTCFILQSY